MFQYIGQFPILTTKKNRQITDTYKFRREFIEFLSNLSLHCYHWMIEPKRIYWEKLLWITVHLIGITSMVIILKLTWENYTKNPLVTTLYDTLYPILNIPFPAIAVCSNNVISLRKAKQFAKELAAKDKQNRSEDFFLNGIQHMGEMYDFNTDDSFDYLTFQNIMDESEVTKPFLNTSSKLKMLSPNCNDFMLLCLWNGKKRKCMHNNMFQVKPSPNGYCCAFNFASKPDLNLLEDKEQTFYTSTYGTGSGLTMYFNASLENYWYPLHPFNGFIIQIFNADEYPDVLSGGVSQIIIQSGSETWLRIGSYIVESEKEIQRYSPEKRLCMFKHEKLKGLRANYYRSNCIVNCRADSILALCNCVPFYYQISRANRSAIQECTMEHLPCLNHYKLKWLSLLFSQTKMHGVEKEFEDGLSCMHCFPSCSHIQYTITTTQIPLKRTTTENENYTLNEFQDISDLSLVRIFFEKPDAWLYKQYVRVKWFTIVSDFGGLCGIITGFSLISAAEVGYFIILQIILTIRSKIRNQSRTSMTTSTTGIEFCS